jgi:hypothetical protein
MKFAQLFILVLAFLIIKPASAGLLIEPLVGFSKGEVTTTSDGIAKDKFDFTGMSYGGRLGYQQLGFQLGLDYLNSNNTIEDSDLESGNYASFNHSVLLDVTELSTKEQMAAYEIADYNFERDIEHE